MTVSEFLVDTNYVLRGIDDDAPSFGTEEALQWVAALNRVKRRLFRNSKVLFDETWEVKSLGAITATATPTFNCDATLIAPSDEVYAVDSNSQTIWYDMTSARRRPKQGRQFYLAGMNPKVLYCSNAIAADEDIVTGELFLPGYYMPADVTASDDTVPLPDPDWGVMAVAAEIAFNDITYEDKSADLNTKANELYMQMIRTNRRNTYNSPKAIPTNVNRIRGTERS